MKKNKCPKCKCQELIIERFRDENQKYIAEKISCARCWKIKYAEENGVIQYENWKHSKEVIIKLNWIQRLRHRLKRKK